MSLTDCAPVSSSTSNTIRRSVTFERRGVGHVALLALLDVVFRLLELVAHEFEHGGSREILDREDRLEHGLQPVAVRPPSGRRPNSGTGRRSSSEPRSGSALPRLRGCCRNTCGYACDRRTFEPCSSSPFVCSRAAIRRGTGRSRLRIRLCGSYSCTTVPPAQLPNPERSP